MRHGNTGRKFSITSSHKKALFRNMMVSLFENEIIRTTLPKAKEIRRYAEPLITLSKNNTLAAKRLAFDRLRSRDAVTKLFNEIGPRYANRPGGYLRVLRLSVTTRFRLGWAFGDCFRRPD